MRNRTVQSVLARRSMNNGGMVAPPTQASGILRSSPSLIDAVSNDALSDMGGGTLSMAQGGAAVNMQPSYVFNQGGIARYAHGGSHSSPNGMDANNVVTKVLNGTANAEEINAIEQSSLMNQPDIARAVRLYKGIEPGGPINLRPGANVESFMKAQPGEIQQRDKARDLKVGNLTPADRKIATQTSDQMTNQRPEFDSNRLRMMGATEADIAKERQLYNEIYSSPESAFKRPAGEMSAGEAAIVQQAEAAADRSVPNFEGDNQQAFLVEERNKSGVTGFFPTNDPATDNSLREVSVQELPPPFDSSGDQGEGPSTKSTTEEVNAQTQMLAEIAAETEALAAATNKNTETNAVEAVINLSKNLSTEAGSDVGGEAASSEESIIVTDPENGVATPVDQNLIFSAINSNGPNTAPAITSSLLEDLKARGTDLVAGKPTDMDSLKKRIEALIPAVEEDPQTQGLLIAMLGASIAGGTSSNAMTNIANGMQKALPGLINFGMKQKAAERNRQTEIGKLVLGEELQIIREGRADKREIAKEGRQITDWVSGPKVQVINGKKIPPFSPQSMTQDEYNLFKKKHPNFPLYRLAPIKLDLQKTTTGKPTLKEMTQKAKLINQLMTRDNDPGAAFKAFGSEVQLSKLTLNSAGKVMLKDPANIGIARSLGLTRIVKVENPDTGKEEEKEILNLGSVADENDVQKFTGEYQRISGIYRNIYDELGKLYELTNKVQGKASLVGPGTVFGKIGDMASAFTGFPGAAQLAAYALGKDGELSPGTAFENKGRLTLAKITPMILGESGKTISDADRIRVAKALGYRIDTVDGVQVIGELTRNIFTSKAQIQNALNEVSFVIRNSYLNIHKIYQQEMIGVGREIEAFDKKKGYKPTKMLKFSLIPKKNKGPS